MLNHTVAHATYKQQFLPVRQALSYIPGLNAGALRKVR